MKKNLLVFTLFSSILLLTGCSLVGTKKTTQLLPPDQHTNKQEGFVEQSSEPTRPLEEKKADIETKDGVGLLYKNDDDGFEFSFNKGYENIWYVTEEKIANEGIIKNYTFYIKNAPNPDIFVIHVFKTSWWNTNTEIDKEKESWVKGVPRDLSTALGTFLGSNNNFTFTLWPNNQTCPDLGDTPGPLCKLTENKIEMVEKSFKVIIK